MAAKSLTDISIKNLRPAATRREIPDGKSRGLYVVVQPSGQRGFAVRYRHGGRPKKLTLPGGMSLAAARKLAADALYEVAQGRDPAQAKQAAKDKAARAAKDTLLAIAEEYLTREAKNLRTMDQRAAILKRLVYPVLGAKQIDTIGRSDIVRLLDKIEDRSGPRMADMVLAILRRVFNWHAARSDTFRTPIVRGMTKIAEPSTRARSRILTDDELRAVWAATADATAFSSLVRFLLLSAARRSEAAAMKWSEVSDGIWTLPAARNKVKRDLIRPLSQAAKAVLDAQPRIEGCPYVFSIVGRRPISGFSKLKQRLAQASGTDKWTLHDIRRTARTLLSRAGVSADIAEMCLGHTLPTIRATYDRHNFETEMRAAFEALAAQIERLVNPSAAENIILLRTR